MMIDEENEMITWPWNTIVTMDMRTGRFYIEDTEVYYDAANQVYRPLGK